MTPDSTREVYGLHLTGVNSEGLPPASAPGLPCVAVGHARQAREPACVSTKRATLDLPEGRQLLLEQGERTATFTGLPLSHDELVHPYLGAAACIFNRWAGREVYHAGAFICGGLAWAVVGAREAGKSSLLAALAARRIPVLADDLVVTDGQQVFCGPRAIIFAGPGSCHGAGDAGPGSQPVAARAPATARRSAARGVDLPALARRSGHGLGAGGHFAGPPGGRANLARTAFRSSDAARPLGSSRMGPWAPG